MWAMRLSRQGYGSITEIKNLDVSTFLNLIHYENYIDKYQYVFRELNKREK